MGEAASGSEAAGEELCSSRRVRVIEGRHNPCHRVCTRLGFAWSSLILNIVDAEQGL